MEVYVCEGAYSRPAFLADLTLPFGRKEGSLYVLWKRKGYSDDQSIWSRL